MRTGIRQLDREAQFQLLESQAAVTDTNSRQGHIQPAHHFVIAALEIEVVQRRERRNSAQRIKGTAGPCHARQQAVQMVGRSDSAIESGLHFR
ncbi:hypothetical protein D3C78_1351590 [compost metagenome]